MGWRDMFRAKLDADSTKLLRSITIFQDLNSYELERIAGYFRQGSYGKGEVICREGERGEVMYVIKEGAVRVQKQLESGEEKTLANLVDGECFGELSILDGEERSATVVAVSNLSMLEMYRSSLLELIRKQPRIAVKVLFSLARVTGGRLRETGDKVKALTMLREVKSASPAKEK